MKKNIFVSLIILFVASASAHAVVQQGWERPILAAEMEVSEATLNFDGVKVVDLTMTRQDGSETPTGFKVGFMNSGSERTVNLIISSIERGSCGSTVYVADLPGREPHQPETFARFHLRLVDHSTRLCDDARPYAWEASVSQGWGWCGTGDSHMKFAGNPEPVYTIQ
ncbi:MAG: hypothetical protein AABZ06_05460 [Bdellovibrionota bacterium]